MEKQIKEAIDKLVAEHLPAQMGSAFTTFFAKALENEKLAQAQKTAIDTQLQRILDLEEKKRLFEQTEERAAVVTKREAEVKRREDALEMTLLVERVNSSEKRAIELHALVSNLVRNTEFRRDVFTSKSYQSMYGGSGNENVEASRSVSDTTTAT